MTSTGTDGSKVSEPKIPQLVAIEFGFELWGGRSQRLRRRARADNGHTDRISPFASLPERLLDRLDAVLNANGYD